MPKKELDCLTFLLHTVGGLQKDNPACYQVNGSKTLWLFSKLKQSQKAEPNSSYQQVGADWGLQTLRQACFQENPESAMCVQNFDDSRGLAIRITYRISLRSSSLWEPRHPLLKVVNVSIGFGKGQGCIQKSTHRTNPLASDPWFNSGYHNSRKKEVWLWGLLHTVSTCRQTSTNCTEFT